jgi:hypothetical protein
MRSLLAWNDPSPFRQWIGYCTVLTTVLRLYVRKREPNSDNLKLSLVRSSMLEEIVFVVVAIHKTLNQQQQQVACTQ